jgi:leader peptidase (prepilin peptidase)/N-methyltransferase
MIVNYDAVMGAYLIGIAGVFGLLIGSFLNVVIYRVPNGMSIVAPPSACPTCGNQIKSYDNIPVVSWLMLKAKCRNCKSKISARYPLVESATAIFFGLVSATIIPQLLSGELSAREITAGVLTLAALLYLAGISVSLALIDLDTHKLPDAIVLPAYIVSGVFFTAASFAQGDFDGLPRAAIGMGALFLFYFIMAFAFPGGMGLGDVKLAGALGIYLGWAGWGSLATGAIAAFILGGLFAVVLVITRRANRKSGIPFGPWMILGAWVGIAFGNQLFAGYLTLFGLTAH